MKKNKGIIITCSLLLLVLIVGIIFTNKSFSAPLENDVEVEVDTELKYFIDVFYDGKDINSVESSATVTADVNSKVINVSDKLPEGLTFQSFVTTSNGSIGAVKVSDGSLCPGLVIDDTNDPSATTGRWNSTNTEYTYHGLHYNANTREVTFKVKNLKAGCKLTVGVITKTPNTVDDPSTTVVETRRDFYNTADGNENNVSVKSNTVHVYMGDKNATLYTVKYEYTGTVPSNASALPGDENYQSGTTVGVQNNANADGYAFSGWTTTDTSISNGSFTMPGNTVTLRGSFTAKQSYKVTYVIDGVKPEDYVEPREKSYYEGNTVDVDSLKPGDIINGYRFLGWESTDVTIDSNDNDFTMPNKNVVIKGKFEEVKYKVEYRFFDTVLPPNSDSFLPATREYRAGQTVNLSNVLNEPTGYRFLGWYKEDPFEMPNKDVIIYGEWMQITGEFEPVITKEIVDPKASYMAGEYVTFKITVTNTASFPIREVIVKELRDGVEYLSGTGYTINSEHFVTIDTIPAGGNVEINARYLVVGSDIGTIKNEVELMGALADNNYYLKDKEYKAEVEFVVVRSGTLKINKVNEDNASLTGAEFTLYQNNVAVQTGLEFSLAPGTYKLKETRAPAGYKLSSREYTINVNNSGVITVTGETLTNDPSDNIIKVLKVINEKINMLPNTGGVGTYVFIFGGLALMIIGGIGTFIITRKDNKKKENKKSKTKGVRE